MAEGRLDGATMAGFMGVVVFLGINFVAVRFSNAEIDPFWGASLRFFAASLILTGIVFVSRAPWPDRQALRGTFLYGVLTFAAVYGLLYWALVVLPAATGALVFATIPLLTFLFAVLVRLERFRWRGIAGALIVIGGVWVLVQGGLWGGGAERFLALFAAAAAAAAAGIVVKRSPRVHPMAMNAVGMGVAVPFLMVASLFSGEAWTLPRMAATQVAFVWLVTSSILAFVLMVWVLGRWTASAVAYGGVLAPLVTILVAHFLVDEPLTGPFLVGGLLIVIGVYIGALLPVRSPGMAGVAVRVDDPSNVPVDPLEESGAGARRVP